MYYLIIALSLVMAGELEVQGNLNVTGDINSPTIDALSGMKLERIYYFDRSENESFSFTVPVGKVWSLLTTSEYNEINISVNGTKVTLLNGNVQYNISLLPGSVISNYTGSPYIMNIYEYPISGSGTDQGMEYIVP